jgi:hypothetical protein
MFIQNIIDFQYSKTLKVLVDLQYQKQAILLSAPCSLHNLIYYETSYYNSRNVRRDY